MKKIKILAALTLALCLSATSADAAKLRLMSYNIRFISPEDKGEFSWESRKAANIAMFNDVDPDVFGLQEPMWGISEYLFDNLPAYDHYLAYRDPEGGKNGRCQIIFWKKDKYDLLDKGMFYLSETPETYSRSWDSSQVRYTVYVKLRDRRTGDEFWYFDTHLDHRGPIAKQNGAKVNVEKMKELAGEDAVVFISGDMNIQREKSNGSWLDPYFEWMSWARSSARKTCDRYTFNGFGHEGKNAGWLDHILFRNAKALRYDVIDSDGYGVKYISDHYPIICDFKF